MMSASREMLRGLQKAKDNFLAAQNECMNLSKDQTVWVVVPDHLYALPK